MGLPLMLEPLVYGIVNAILEGRLHTAHKKSKPFEQRTRRRALSAPVAVVSKSSLPERL